MGDITAIMNQQKLGVKSKFTSAARCGEPPGECSFFPAVGQNIPEEEPSEETNSELRKYEKEIEDYLKCRTHCLEEKMFERFYLMRIEESRKFIDLIRKINKSWDDFVDYLKSIGGQGASGDGDCTVYSITNTSSLTAVSQITNDSK
ncbi:hypothetical protein TcasGA2_TC009156 [Tribolium castaneum]|uniref:Uncharacterized protein n=1 Tax=Tribolium castaneum TaxID=7070 RepID=D6WTQ6_TRICA|nr:hypothetical protein TcasGA2_TC009156 [Tribolium castaneum]